ncbi:hypothetical protein SAMN06265350_10850 [Solitalea koreensis]|uniref:CAAX protease self-immunity n=1 Tax=Solitalea koreensis TaxID=543615 RepID=A0A521DTQ3_9SPHI|nr:hypothetical protein SAMN06265350_10850 [Solitalea koreensis]
MKKTFIFLILALLISNQCYCHPYNSEIKQNVIHNGIGLGSVVAVVLSWDRNKSILLAVLHAIFSWFYVIYFALTREPIKIKWW